MFINLMFILRITMTKNSNFNPFFYFLLISAHNIKVSDESF